MINAASIKARLKNHAKESGHTLQNELTMYGLERTIYRISISPYATKFTLKGGIFLYALFDGDFARATTDIDLLAKDTSNDAEAIKETFVHRNTGHHDIVAFEPDFAEDGIRQSRWRAFIKKKKAMIAVELREVLELFRIFLEPIVEAIVVGEDFELKWNCKDTCWE